MTEPNETKRDESLDQELTELVSYLDGELDVDQMTQIECQLASNSAMRSHADILSKTWCMLDDLEPEPESSASEHFTRQTMATIESESEGTASVRSGGLFVPRALGWLARHHVLPAFLIGVLGGVLGLLINHRMVHRRIDDLTRRDPSDPMVIDPSVLQNIALFPHAAEYEGVPSIEDLRQLNLSIETEDNVTGEGVSQDSKEAVD